MKAVEEEWRPCPGYDNYAVSDHGRVLSCWTQMPPRYLRPGISRGYLHVDLSRDGKGATLKVHRLVLMAFIGPSPPGKPECNHRDGGKANNRLSNLEWVSSAENQRHAYDTGLQVGPRGEVNGAAKLTEADVIEIRNAPHTGRGHQTRLAREFGVGRNAVSMIVRGKTWVHVA